MHKVLQSSDSSYSKTLNNQPRDEVMCSKNSEKMESTVSIGCDKVQKQLKDAQSFIKSTKLERSLSISELECTQTENWCLNKMVDAGRVTNGKFIDQREDDKATDSIVQVDENEISGILALQAKLGKLFKDLMDAEILARQRLEDCATQNSEDCQSELACNYAEVGISQTIIHLQEEICRLQSEFKVRLCSMAEQNKFLRNSVAAKEDEMRFLCAEWEKATLELTTFLIGGSRSLKDVSNQINGISTSFPNVNDWISERVSVAAKICIEKEETILQLQKCLEDAQNSVMQLDSTAGTADLTQLFKLATHEAKKCLPQNRTFRVILIYCRSSLPPQYHLPSTLKLFTLDVVYLHDKPGPDNCPQLVYDTLVEALERVSEFGYVFETGQGLTRSLFRHMCLLLCHPQQRCLQDDMDIPKLLTKKSAAAETTSGEGNTVISIQ